MSQSTIEKENDSAIPDSVASPSQNLPKRPTFLRLCLVLLCWAVTLLLIVGWKSILVLDTYTLGFALILLGIMLVPQFVFPRKRRYQLALFLVFVLAGIVTMMYIMPPVWGGPKTTYLSSPLKANGAVDYFKAAKAKCDCDCKTQDNGVTLLAAAVGKPLLFRLHYGITGNEKSDDANLLFVQTAEGYWRQLCTELELDPELKATHSYEPPYDYYLAVQDKRLDAAALSAKAKMTQKTTKDEKANPKDEKANPKDEKANPKDEKANPKNEKVISKDEKANPKDEKVISKDEKVNPKNEKAISKDEKANPKMPAKSETQAKTSEQSGSPSSPQQELRVARYNVLLTKPWTAKSEPEMAQWLQENGPALDLFSQAVYKPKFFVPMIRLDEEQPLAYVPSFTISVARPLAEGLRIRMTYALGKKDADAAWANWNALCRMTSHLIPHSRSGTDTLGLMRVPLDAAVVLIDAKVLKPETLRQMLDIIDKIPHELNLKDSAYRERLETLDNYMAIISGSDKIWRQIDRTGQVGAYDRFTHFSSRLARTVPLSEPLDQINLAYDELDNAIETGQWPDWQQKRVLPFRLTTIERVQVFLRAGVWHLFPMILADSQLCSLELSDASPMMITRWKKLRAQKEMCKIAIALEIYRAKNNALPKSLDELKSILGTVPTDPFASEKSFVYRCDSKLPAGYLLYSIGMNQRDDEGMPMTESKSQADDIPLR